MDEKSCANCRYSFTKTKTVQLQCRRFPPTAVYVQCGDDPNAVKPLQFGMFPIIAEAPCGEYERESQFVTGTERQ